MGWEFVKLGDLVHRKIGYGIVQPGANVDVGVPVIKVNNIISGLSNIELLEKTTTDIDARYTRTRLVGGELVISLVGSVGKTAIVPKTFAGCNLVRATGLIDIKDEILAKWVKYYIDSPQGQAYINSNVNTTVQVTLNIKSLSDMPIPLPDHAIREKIVAILSSLDDKIELNRRINANLEQQAQALYKSWFVDFEPFGGKMPEDWREGTLGEIAEFRRGKGILGKDTIKGNIPVVAGGLEPAYYHNLANTKAPVVTISASGANAGFMRMYNVDVWASDCSYIDSRCANLLWTYCYLKINAQLLKHAQTGAVQPHVKASDVNAFEIIIPSSENILNFQQKVKPIFDQIANNERENIHLSQLRDTLLPKLMSGEITV